MKQRIIKISGFILISFFVLSLSITITINFIPLYAFDINYLNISTYVDIPREQILANYRILLDYLNSPWISELDMPDFPSSNSGLFHFLEVKKLFLLNYLILTISGTGTFFFLVYAKNKKLYKSFLLYFQFGILLSLTIIVTIIIRFDALFLLFHQTFFNNDAWLFNPATDPIILVLPAEFFMHNFLLAFGLVEMFLVVGYVIAKIEIRNQDNLTQRKGLIRQIGVENEFSTVK
ncbi:TIGR01906 family membrane protein [Alkalibacterium sp. f15]|uniref:TIGR01906 family membrane protein n=1 Tax=Alkalibacterium sp. f15 TaxID=3414029 RepID=UPI003BF7AE39